MGMQGAQAECADTSVGEGWLHQQGLGHVCAWLSRHTLLMWRHHAADVGWPRMGCTVV